MKKVLIFFITALCSIGNAMADTYTVTYQNGGGTSGQFYQSNSKVSENGWKAAEWVSVAPPYVTISNKRSDGTYGTNGLKTDDYHLASDRTFSISVAGPYTITGYRIYTSSGWGAIVTAETGETETFSGEKSLTVPVSDKKSTTFTTAPSPAANLNSPVIEIYLKDDPTYPINFNTIQTFTRSDRHINSVSFNGQTITGLYENTSTTCYQDLTATKTLKLLPNTSITPSFNVTGGWQHGFVYIDLNKDGDFTDEGELVSKINEGNPTLSTAMPAFTSPASLGTYRMRIKTDWSSVDPGGNEGAEPGNVNGSNHIISNGGMIVDITLEITEDYTDMLTDITKPFTDYPAASGYFRMTSDNATSFLGMIETARTGDGIIDEDEYNALLEYFKGLVRFPDTGYYLIKNSDSNNYLAYGTPGEAGKAVGLITTEGDPTPANIIRLTKVGFNEYTISSQGLNVQARAGANNTFPMSASDAVVFSFVPQNATSLKITNTDSYVNSTNPGTLFEAHWTKPYAVVNWEPSGAQGQWTIETATSTNVTLNGPVGGSYYATLCVPFACTIDGATAYTLTLNATQTGLTLSEGTTGISAGTPVLLKGSSNTASLNIASNATYATTPSLGTALTGTFTGMGVTGSTDYFLGMADSKVGFYHWDGTTIAANRAYLEASKLNNGGNGVKGFVLDFDSVDAIKSLFDAQDDSQIYNLAGQRISKLQKGIYIINGKKVLVK